MIKELIIKLLGGFTSDELNGYEKHIFLSSFRHYLKNNIPEKEIMYDYDGRGKKRHHLILGITPNEEKAYLKWLKTLINFDEFHNSDQLIYELNIKINDFIDGKYRSDEMVWGKIEYWETPTELFRVLVEQRKGLDCDSVSLFKYHCFRTAFKHKKWWAINKWRLRVFVCDILSVSGKYRHATLAWVKNKFNNWMPIESTFYPKKFAQIWKNNKSFGYLYEIDYSIDEDAEYKKLEV